MGTSGRNDGDNYIPMYADLGCDYFPKCLTCPLSRCYQEFPGTPSHPTSKLRDAILDTWAKGGRDERLLPLFKGDVELIPEEVLDHYGRVPKRPNKLLRPAAALAALGLTNKLIGALLRAHPETVALVLRTGKETR